QKKVNLTEGAGQEYLKGQQQGCQLSLLVHIEKKPKKTTGWDKSSDKNKCKIREKAEVAHQETIEDCPAETRETKSE
ncbi:hypothetical protein PANDA_000421, partial [Ailuropoda melanoleuca]